MQWFSDPLSPLAIFLAAAVTYSLRFGGLMLAGRLPQSGRLRRAMDALPGAILLALVTPSIAASGWWGLGAAFCTAGVVVRTGNALLAMLAGMAVILIQRHLVM